MHFHSLVFHARSIALCRHPRAHFFALDCVCGIGYTVSIAVCYTVMRLDSVLGIEEGGGLEQARRMLMELEALTHAFVQALAKVGSAVQAQAGAQADGITETAGVVADLSKELEQDLSSAVGRVAEAFRGLLYVVLLAAQDREVLQAS
jgi:hypothetical protein